MPSQLSAYQQLFKNFLQLLAILIAVILILAFMILPEQLVWGAMPGTNLPSLFKFTVLVQGKKIPPRDRL